MQFTYYGHSCFSVAINGKHILFDPFISPNALASDIDIRKVKADYILVSHGHEDHIADCIAIAKRTGAKVVCNFEIHSWLQQNGIVNTHPMNTGGKWDFGDFTVKSVTAQHSSSLPDGTYAGNPMGFILFTNKGNFYYSGDTALTLDMQLIPRWVKLNFAVLPIGDNFTMNAEDALACAEMIQCKEVIGVHYDTFGYIKIDHKAAIETFSSAGRNLSLLPVGQTIDLNYH